MSKLNLIAATKGTPMKSSIITLVLTLGLLSTTTNAQSIFLDEEGTMVVNGSFRHETITVWQQTHFMRGGGRTTFVYASIQAFGYSMQERFEVDDVEKIEVNAMGGDDNVDNKTGIASEIDGGSGDDVLKGGDGNDTIFGGNGSNEMYGREGVDMIVSNGDAYNYMVGGMGRDIFLAFPFDRIYDPKYSDDGTELIGYAFLLWPTLPGPDGSSWFSE